MSCSIVVNKNIIIHTLTSFGILDAILRPKEASQDIIRLDFERIICPQIAPMGPKIKKIRCELICQYFFHIFKRPLLQVKPRL